MMPLKNKMVSQKEMHKLDKLKLYNSQLAVSNWERTNYSIADIKKQTQFFSMQFAMLAIQVT